MIWDSVAHNTLLEDHASWCRDKNRKNGDSGRKGFLKPSAPVKWSEWEALGLDDPWEYEENFLFDRGFDPSKMSKAINLS